MLVFKLGHMGAESLTVLDPPVVMIAFIGPYFTMVIYLPTIMGYYHCLNHTGESINERTELFVLSMLIQLYFNKAKHDALMSLYQKLYGYVKVI